MFWPCDTRTSTCRNLATISSGLYRFLAITVLLDVKDIISSRTTSVGADHEAENGEGWLMSYKLGCACTALVGAIAISAITPSRADIVYNLNLQVGIGSVT